MRFTQYYLDCLSQASYLIADDNTKKAVIVDPRRDIEEYLVDLRDGGYELIGVINTHFHADFVSGHLELAQETGAWIGYGEAATTDFDIKTLADNECINLGDVTLTIMATPGHTPESISVLVHQHSDDDVAYGVLTGDTLFIGDVGRPDLLASIGVTADELGAMLYDSIHNKMMSLDDSVRVFPAHGAGSACGKNLSTEKQSTIGEQRRTNYACQPMSEKEFVDIVTEGQPTAPGYFVYNATLNRQKRSVREPASTVPSLTADAFDAALANGAVVLDARDPQEFAVGHVKGSINVGAKGRLAETVGMVFTPDDDIVIIAEKGAEQETAVRLARIGFDNVVGYLAEPEDYFVDHEEQIRHASRIAVSKLADLQHDIDIQLVDIRNPGEVVSGMIDGAVHIPLPHLAERSTELSKDKPIIVYCAGGWRSSVAASLLRHQGFTDSSDLLGGYTAWNSVHGKI